jgi:hypothetical protein
MRSPCEDDRQFSKRFWATPNKPLRKLACFICCGMKRGQDVALQIALIVCARMTGPEATSMLPWRSQAAHTKRGRVS